MAVQFIGINRGAQLDGITTGTSTTSKDMEVTVDLTKNMTRKEILDNLDRFRDFIANTRSTPFAQ